MTGQLEDYRAAMAAAARLPGVDPQRLVLWGVSLSGGHVLEAAADRDDVAAVVVADPAGRRARRRPARAGQPHQAAEMLRSTVAGVRSRTASARGRPAVMMPVVGRPGEVGALTLDGCYDDYLAIAGPTWRNEIDASVGLELGGHRPAKHAKRLSLPGARADRRLRPERSAARRGEGGLRGPRRGAALPVRPLRRLARQAWFDAAVAHQVAFLTPAPGLAAGSVRRSPRSDAVGRSDHRRPTIDGQSASSISE